MIRKILGVIVGYAIFVVSSLALFQLTGQKPHAETTVTFQLITAVYGICFSLLSGFVLALIARPTNLAVNLVLALIMASFAVFSFVKAEGTHWTQLMAIFVFAPTSMLGGYFYLGRNRTK